MLPQVLYRFCEQEEGSRKIGDYILTGRDSESENGKRNRFGSLSVPITCMLWVLSKRDTITPFILTQKGPITCWPFIRTILEICVASDKLPSYFNKHGIECGYVKTRIFYKCLHCL